MSNGRGCRRYRAAVTTVCVLVSAAAGAAEPPGLERVDHMRLSALRRQLQLDGRSLAAMGWEPARTRAVLVAVRDWFASNRARLHEANVKLNQAVFAIDEAKRQAATTRPAATRPGEPPLEAAERARADAAARVRAVQRELLAAVEAELTGPQRRTWRAVRAAAEAGGRRDWVHATGLTSEQAAALAAAELDRRRAYGATGRRRGPRRQADAEFAQRAAAILSKAQLAAVESARAAREANHSAVRAAERELLPEPPRHRVTVPPVAATTQPVRRGLAERYPRDRGIAENPAVVFACDFEAADWPRQWGGTDPPRNAETVAEDDTLKFRPLDGKALKVTVPKGANFGTSLKCSLKKLLGAEPEEIHFRYYLRLADDWRPVRGGKLPGIGGTYGRGGWGGRRSTGINGWSARGLFMGRTGGRTPIGFYCYNADQPTIYGDHWVWETDGLGFIENNRWYCIEQYARMNTPGRNDGVLRGWVDGRLAFEKTDIRMRDVAALRIQSVWINVYFGGTWTARYTNHLYVDNVVIARKYIGPMVRGR